MDGTTPDIELTKRGVIIGIVVTGEHESTCTINAWNQDANTVTRVDDDSNDTEVDRITLLRDFNVCKEVEPRVCAAYPCPSSHIEMKVDVWKGGIKHTLVHE